MTGTINLQRGVQLLLICAALICGAKPASAQTQLEQQTEGGPARQEQKQAPAAKPQAAEPAPAPAAHPKDGSEGKQPKRILWIIPNYRAVSAGTQLPPLALKDKFWLATQDSFDYSSFFLAGVLAATGQARTSTPQFRQGAAGFGRYYWHSFADQAVGNYLTEAIVPAVTREDPRYYTLGHGGFFVRTGYAVSRLFVTKADSGHRTFNFSEIVGNGAGAGVSD